jgi:tryptophanyl-tRNA synthetase
MGWGSEQRQSTFCCARPAASLRASGAHPLPTLSAMPQRVLTGITTTGTLHLGNYVGAVRPCIEASRESGVESFFFMADYHALIKCDEPDRIEASRLQIAATWIAAGLDTDRATFYRQSDIPEIPELTWLLTCVTSKGQMNRAHAYKASVDANTAAGEEPDAGVTMGLYCYPILMAADILMFNAHRVPVGKDQVQHIEMARDVAQRFNHLFGKGKEFFVLPEAQVDEEMELLPGLDGRKMSKSYDNVIPLFEGGSKALREAIARIVTDSRLPGEPKDPEGAHLVTIFDAFANAEERAAFRAELRAGLAWGKPSSGCSTRSSGRSARCARVTTS